MEQAQQSTEPRILTIDEAVQLPMIRIIPEEQRTDEQKEIWRVFKTRQEWESKHRRDIKDAENEAKAAGRAYEAAYRKRLMDMDRAERLKVKPLTAAEFKQAVERGTTSIASLKLNCDKATATEYMREAYLSAIRQSGGTPIIDDRTSHAVAFAAAWLTSDTKQGFMLRGGVGCGKTTLLHAVRTTLNVAAQKSLPIIDSTEVAEHGLEKAWMERYSQCPLLGIDDLGAERLSLKDYGNEVTPMVTLLTERYKHRLPTFITTNLQVVDGKDEISTRYGERIADRLGELCNTFTYGNNCQSYRQRVSINQRTAPEVVPYPTDEE